MNRSVRKLPLLGGAISESNHRTKGLLRLTMACNERCPFCNVPVEDYPHPTPPESEIRADLEAFIASGERTLTISGGEPTLYKKRLVAVVAEARARGVPFVELQTNAVLIDEDYAQALAEAGLTSAFVSLLSHRAELHDELAGLSGAFDPCLRGIDALVDAGVAVTLNPVVASQTQTLVAEYVDFVADRLPSVKTISLSAVQPHGRASKALELLPDYGVLAIEVPRARKRAAHHGITLLNPYCGLPVCIGWQDDLEHSVEAIEARADRAERPAGIDNRGNKRHGPPCASCALRTRCGGAWHAYWKVRDGRGIHAPLDRREPFAEAAYRAPGQTVIGSETDLDRATLDRIATAETPTVWLISRQLRPGDGDRLREAGATDLALLTDARALAADSDTLSELASIARSNRELEPQSKIRVSVGIQRLESFVVAHRTLELLARAEVEAVRLLVRTSPKLARFAEAASAALGLEVTVPE